MRNPILCSICKAACAPTQLHRALDSVGSPVYCQVHQELTWLEWYADAQLRDCEIGAPLEEMVADPPQPLPGEDPACGNVHVAYIELNGTRWVQWPDGKWRTQSKDGTWWTKDEHGWHPLYGEHA